MTFKVLCGEAPSYLCDLKTPYVPPRTLGSQNKLPLHQPRFHLKSYGQRAFKPSAPYLWNDLSYNVKNSKDINDFKKRLKTHLFKKAFALWCDIYYIFEDLKLGSNFISFTYYFI